MTTLPRLSLALAAATLASTALATTHAANGWPSTNPKDKAHFCGSEASADGTAPRGYGARLNAEMRRLESSAGMSTPQAMTHIATLAGCPRETWQAIEVALPEPSTSQRDAFGLSWPAASPADAARLCEHPTKDGMPPPTPANYMANLQRALLARTATGMSLELTVQDIRKAAGCPLNKRTALQPPPTLL